MVAQSLTWALQSGDGSDLKPTATGPRERVVTYASLRVRSAELRMREAYAALEAAELTGALPIELERLEHSFLHARRRPTTQHAPCPRKWRQVQCAHLPRAAVIASGMPRWEEGRLAGGLRPYASSTGPLRCRSTPVAVLTSAHHAHEYPVVVTPLYLKGFSGHSPRRRRRCTRDGSMRDYATMCRAQAFSGTALASLARIGTNSSVWRCRSPVR